MIFLVIAVFMWMFVVPYLEALKLQKEPRMVTEMEFRFWQQEKAALGIPPTPPDHEEF